MVSRPGHRSSNLRVNQGFPEDQGGKPDSWAPIDMYHGTTSVPSYYSKRSGDCVYDVSVTERDFRSPARRYRAHLSNVERIEDGCLVLQNPNIADTYGPTASEAVEALDASIEKWRSEPRLNLL